MNSPHLVLPILTACVFLAACDNNHQPAAASDTPDATAPILAHTPIPSPSPSPASIDEAIARGDIDTVRSILAADPAAAGTGSQPTSPPLHQAINRKRTEIALLLIETGADVNALDSSRRTPLHLCVERDLPGLVAPLTRAGAKPDERDSMGWTPLHHTGAKNRIAVATALLDNGADINARSERGGTPMHEAAASGGAEIIQLFLDHGSDISVVASNGVTALDVAEEFKNEVAIKLLSAPNE